VLHMLRGILGDDVFRQVLQAYVNHPEARYGTATSALFQEVAETVSGTSLGYFFDQWLLRAGYPIYEIGWRYERTGPGAYELRVEVSQIQVQPAFRMPISIAVETTAGERRFQIFNSEREESFVLALDAEPIALLFDPDFYLLRNENVPVLPLATDGRILPDRASMVSVYPNPSDGVFSVLLELPEPQFVRVQLFDSLGRMVLTVTEEPFAAGRHRLDVDGRALAAGVYFLRMTHDAGTDVQRVVIL
jgi:aminopeptidase N